MAKIILTIIKKDSKSLSSLTLVWAIIRSGMVNILLENVNFSNG